jgi:serine/threonine-protein kinase
MTYKIELEAEGSTQVASAAASDAPVATRATASRSQKVLSLTPAPSRAKAEMPAPEPQPKGDMVTINLNSIPPSNVIVNGRPMGKTPKLGVKVPAGAQSIVFMHPDKGRKRVSVTVPAGGAKTISVSFK